jgi:hypothetical protein
MLREGWRHRALSATLALLIQGLFLTMAFLSISRPIKPNISHPLETILFFPAIPNKLPTTIDARGPLSDTPKRVIPTLPTPFQLPTIKPSVAPPTGLAAFGQALFDCAPERLPYLTTDERARCARVNESLTRNEDRDSVTEPRSHAKYEARWKEQWAEDHWVPAPCLPTGRVSVAQCLMDQAIAENRRVRAAWREIAEQEANIGNTIVPAKPILGGHQPAKSTNR